MFKTDKNWLYNDLMDVVRMFSPEDMLEAECDYSLKENSLQVFLRIGTKNYTNSYNLPKSDNEIIIKRYIKRYVKLALFNALENSFPKNLPWGALTGIRPVKLAYQEIENGGDYLSLLKDEMQVSDNKIRLVKDVLENQKGIYKKDDSVFDLFIGIPFCPSKCLYCSFISDEIEKIKKFIVPYTDSLVKEISAAKNLCKKYNSIYIGGGTPVSLPIQEMEKIMNAIGKADVEYTVEAGRPDCITKEKLDLLKDFNVTRICVNPQTFNDVTLEKIGRRHKSKDIIDKYELARNYSFDINMDLIAGLSSESFDDFKRSVDMTVSLSPEDITIHTLSLKKGAALKEQCVYLAEGEVGKMLDYAYETLNKNGYKPYYMYRQKYMAGNYENVGYCKQGKQCAYNINIMEEISQNVACGANAVSKRVFSDENRIERFGNPKDLKTYIEKIDNIIAKKDEFYR